MPSFQLAKTNNTGNAIGNPIFSVDMITQIVSIFTRAPTQESIYVREREEMEWRQKINEELESLEEAYLKNPNSKNARNYLKKLINLQTHFIKTKSRLLIKHGEQHVDTVDFREAVENLNRLQPVIDEFTYLMEQHKSEEKDSKYQESSNIYFDDKSDHFERVAVNKLRLIDPDLIRRMAAEQAKLDGDILSYQELSVSIEKTKVAVAKKIEENKEKLLTHKHSLATLYESKIDMSRKELDEAFTSRIDRKQKYINQQLLNDYLEANFQINNHSKFIKNYMNMVLKYHQFTVVFSSNMADISYDRNSGILFLPLSCEQHCAVNMALIFRYMFQHLLYRTIGNGVKPHPYYPDTQSEKQLFLNMLNTGDMRVQTLYEIHVKKMNKQDCTISENQMYAKYSTAIKVYRGTPFFNIQILNPHQSAYLKSIQAKQGDIVDLPNEGKIKLINLGDTYDIMQYEIVDDKVREFYAFHLNQLIACGARNIQAIMTSPKIDGRFDSDSIREEFQQKHTSNPFTDKEEAVYVEKRDKKLCKIAYIYSTEIIETFYPEVIDYQNQQIQKILDVVVRNENIKMPIDETICRRLGTC